MNLNGKRPKGRRPLRQIRIGVMILPTFRHEIKLLLTKADCAALRVKLKALTEPDPNAGEGGEYFIRSLYFDDISRRSYFEKLAGVADRKKYRLRIYNLSDSVIKLECKEKRGDRIRKRSLSVSKEVADSLINGDFAPLCDIHDPLADEVLSLGTGRLLRPSVVVDYDREAFLYPVSNVRLTFDKALHAGVEGADIFDPKLMSVPVFPDESVIFEIKYDEVLPKHLQKLFSDCRGAKLALSKFTLCRDELSRLKPKP